MTRFCFMQLKILLSLLFFLLCHPAISQLTLTQPDPAAQTRGASISNEYRWLSGGYFMSTLKTQYKEPLPYRPMSLALKIPMQITNLGGDARFGVSDISLEWYWTLFVNGPHIVDVGVEFSAPTASDPLFGTGQWVIAPEVGYAYFVTPQILIAPFYAHSISFAGDKSRPTIHAGDLDLDIFYWPEKQIWSLRSNFGVGYDFVAKTWPADMTVALRLRVARLFGGNLVFSIEPGVGIGPDRAYDFSLKGGFFLFGF